MAQQDMYGMFSNVTPEQAQAAYLNQFMIPQNTLAQLNPYQQVAALVGQGAAQAGAGLGRLFGGKTSLEIEQAQMKDIMSQVADVQDPAERLSKAAALFRQRGMEDKAMALEDRSLGLKKTMGDIGQTEAQTALAKAQADALGVKDINKLTPEQQMVIELAKSGKYTGTSIQAAVKAGDMSKLETTEGKANIENVGFTPKGQVVYFDKNSQVQFTSNGTQRIPYEGPVTSKSGVGSEIAAGLAPLVGAIVGARAKEAGQAEGKKVGEAVATIQGKQDAVISLKNALDLLGNSKTGYNIYAGTWGPGKTLVSKATEGFAFDRTKAINSEQFLAEVSTTVIPMLKEFGGNDSNEELKFLQRVVGGDQSLEPESLERIIKSAKAKIERGIQRIQAQQEATQEGKPLPTGPSPLKATKRWNPATGKLEEVK